LAKDKAKPVVRQGRKATDLLQTAGLPLTKGSPAFFLAALQSSGILFEFFLGSVESSIYKEQIEGITFHHKNNRGDGVKKIRYMPAILVLVLHLLAINAQAQMQSSSYHIPSSVVSSGGSPATSASYKINATAGHSSQLGCSSTNYIIASGVWHVLLGAAVDSDGDGINDNWEMYYFGNLTTANRSSDFDRDGYSDLQEYLNNLNGETDPNGGVYNPKVKNASGGTGYDPSSMTKILFMVIPAIFGGSQ
jgi:hypothetical protein